MEIARTAYFRSEYMYDIKFGDPTFRWRTDTDDLQVSHQGHRRDLNYSSRSRYSYFVHVSLADVAKMIETVEADAPKEKVIEQLEPALKPLIRLVATIAGIGPG
jgi:hypothetical protein